MDPNADDPSSAVCAFDRDLLLRLRTVASEEAKPVDLGLCEAQIDASAHSPDLDSKERKPKGNKGKNQKAATTSAVPGQDPQKRVEGRPSTEGGSGGTSGNEFPWRRGRSADGEGGSGSAPSGLIENGVAGTGAAPGEYPWRRSPPSPETGPTPSPASAQPPWRKSPQGTSPMPSPSISIQDVDLPEGTFEIAMSEDKEQREPFSAVTMHAAQMAQKEVPAASQQIESEPVGDLDAEEFESGDDGDEDQCEAEVAVAEDAKPSEPQEAKTWKSGGWKSDAKKDSGPPLPCDLTASPTPPPPLHSLAGTWLDTLGNVIQVPLYPPMAWFTSESGSTNRELSLDKWGRLWCGNGVLHAVGYNAGPMSQDMPPTHLSWRTTAWKFSVWERVSAPPVAPPAPSKGKGFSDARGAGKGGGRGGGSKRTGGAPRNKTAGDDSRQAVAPPPRAPNLPKLGDFMSFPALGKAEPKKKS